MYFHKIVSSFHGGAGGDSVQLIVKRPVLSDSLAATGTFLSKIFWKAIPPEFHQDFCSAYSFPESVSFTHPGFK
jgi:hypothetical protein